MTREVHAELLLGRKVVDVDGRKAGRIEEMRIEEIDGESVVLEYHLGPFGLLERLSAALLELPLVRLLPKPDGRRYCVKWDLLSLEDPERPTLTCRREELVAPSEES